MNDYMKKVLFKNKHVKDFLNYMEKKEMEVEARVRTEMPGEGLHHVHPSDNEGTEEESTGLSGGIKRMETTFNLPASIREITRKLKGMK